MTLYTISAQKRWRLLILLIGTVTKAMGKQWTSFLYFRSKLLEIAQSVFFAKV